VGGLDASLRFSMDFDLWVRMSAETGFRHVPAFLGSFREHATSKSVAFHTDGNCDGDRYLVEHEHVFRRHFRKKLPSPAQTKWNRLRHKARLAMEQMSEAHRKEVAALRTVTEQQHSPSALWV